MVTDLSDAILLYLHKVAQTRPMYYVPHADLYSRMQASWSVTLDEVTFTAALRYLVGKGYVEEEAAHYRLVSEGQEYALFLRGHPRDVAGVAVKEQRLGNWLAIVSVLLTILIFILGQRACVSGVEQEDFTTPEIIGHTAEPTIQMVIPTIRIQTVIPVDVSDSFRVGDEVVVVLSGSVRVRRTPGYINKPATDTICYASTGERFWVVNGPEYVDKLCWWKVSNERCGQGWIAQSRRSGETILSHP